MTIDERLEALTARHEALTMNVEFMLAERKEERKQDRAEFKRNLAESRVEFKHEMAEHRRQMNADIRKTRYDQRRWAALVVQEARNQRKRQREIDLSITRLAA